MFYSQKRTCINPCKSQTTTTTTTTTKKIILEISQRCVFKLSYQSKRSLYLCVFLLRQQCRNQEVCKVLCSQFSL